MKTNTRWILAVAAAAALAPAAPAQEPADTFELAELVVTATRVPVRREATAASVTVITGGELRARGVRTVADALRALPGVSVAQTGSAGGLTSLFLRGGESDYVQVLIDGVPVNQPGGAFDFADLTTDNIERIEVVRGPTSVLYGSDAVTGVVQILTRNGRGRPRLALAARGGVGDRVGPLVSPEDERSASFGFGADLAGGSERLGYSLSLSRFRTDGAYAFNNQYDNTSASARVRVLPDTRTDAALSLRYTDSEFHFPTDASGRPVDHNQMQLGEALTLALEAGRHLTEALEAKVLVSLHRLEQVQDDQPDETGDGSYRGESALERRGIDVRANVHATPGAIVTAGVELERQEGESASLSRSTFGDFAAATDVERENLGVYLQALAQVAGRVSLVAGVRRDHNGAFGDFETVRAGASVRLIPGARLRLAGGTAFKEPTFAENYGSGFGDVGNPDLRPEESWSVEAGIEQELAGGRLMLEASYFRQRFQNLIQFTFAAPEGEPNYRNVAEARADGLELAARAGLPASITASLQYTYLDTEATDPGFDSGPDAYFVQGRRLLRRPTHSFGASLSGPLTARGTWGLGVDRAGERDDLDFKPDFTVERVRLPGYTLVSAAAEYELLRRAAGAGLTATLRIENLLDEAYEEIRNFRARARAVVLGARMTVAF
ncbi:MAG: TonB-dependent receptor [Gemmatimonadetes bacterium]|nr:TonB-dependent receptor [Gemmatimonadota bacterium]